MIDIYLDQNLYIEIETLILKKFDIEKFDKIILEFCQFENETFVYFYDLFLFYVIF